MRKSLLMLMSGCLVVASISLSGCGGSSSSGSGAAAVSTVSGTASKGEAYVGTVNLKDYRGILRTTTSNPSGYYSFDVSSLTAPFFINAGTLYSIATGPGRTNVNPFTNVIAQSAAGSNPMSTLFSNLSSNRNLISGITTALPTARTSFNNQMQTLYNRYNLTTPPDFLNGAITIDQGVDAIFKDLTVTVSNGNVSISTRDTVPQTIMSGSFTGQNFTINTTTYWNTYIELNGDGENACSTLTTYTYGACSKPITYCIATSGAQIGAWYYLINGTKLVFPMNYQSATYQADLLAFTNAYLAACQ